MQIIKGKPRTGKGSSVHAPQDDDPMVFDIPSHTKKPDVQSAIRKRLKKASKRLRAKH